MLQPASETSLRFRIDRGVLVIEPQGALRVDDFDALEASVDAWLEASPDALHALAVHARQFPGWENFGAALRHLRFVRDHHRKIARVAFAVDGPLAALASTVGKQFVHAEVRRFDADALEAAIEWARSG